MSGPLARSALAVILSATLLGLVLLQSPHVSGAATITVSNTSDSDPGSLRQALADAAPGDMIDFSVTGTITLTSGNLTVGKPVTITGPGAGSLAISGNDASGVFDITAGPTAMSGLTVRNGRAGAGAGILNTGSLVINSSTISNNHADTSGGAIFNNGGSMVITNSTISGNTAWRSAAIHNQDNGTATLENVTVSSNNADNVGGFGGLVINTAGSTITMTNATIADNTAVNTASSVIANFGTVNLKNTILSNNQPGNCGGDITSQGHNISSDNTCLLAGPSDLVNTDPKLEPLADNGGPTQTHALLAGSPAIDAGSSDCPPPATDQRGISRPQGVACDIGAFEREAVGVTQIWGDFDCQNGLSIGDAQKIARFLISLSITQGPGCPQPGQQVTVNGMTVEWGNLDCQNGVTIGDAQKTARKLIDLSVGQAAGCPAPGDTVQVTPG